MAKRQTANLQSQTSNLQSIQKGRLQAWCVNLLSIVADAYHLGAVIGKGVIVRAGAHELSSDVLLVVGISSSGDEIRGTPVLAVDLIPDTTSERQRRERQQHYASAGVQEYWQVDIETAAPAFYQRNLREQYDLIEPDKDGIYFSSHEELFFPAKWFRHQPDLWTMMQYWGMIQDLPEERD